MALISYRTCQEGELKYDTECQLSVNPANHLWGLAINLHRSEEAIPGQCDPQDMVRSVFGTCPARTGVADGARTPRSG